MSDEIKIEKGVPIPEKRLTSLSRAMTSLKVGDSFATPFKRSLYVLASYYKIKITVRQQPDGTMRVWRIK